MKTSVSFDLTEEGELCEGELIYSAGRIMTVCGGNTLSTFTLDNVHELVQRTDIGCGRLEISLKDENGSTLPPSENKKVCRFSMACVNEIGEFCKAVNHYLKTGEEHEVKQEERRRCPVCGRTLISGMDVCMFCLDKRYILKRTVSLLKPFLPAILISGLLLTISNVFSVLLPVLNSWLLDDYLAPAAGAAVPWFTPVTGVLAIGAMMMACYLFGQLFFIFSARKINTVGSRLSDMLRGMTYDKIQNLSLSSMSKKTSGDLLKRVTKDTANVRQFLVDQGRYALQQVIMFIAIAVVLLFTSPFLTLLVFLPIPFALYMISKFWDTIHLRYEKQWRYDSRSNSILHDIIKGIRVVKTFGNEEREVAKFSSVCKRLADLSVKNEHFWACTFPMLSFFVGIGEFFVLFFGGNMVLKGQLSLGEFLRFTLFLAYLYQPLRWMSSLPRWIAEVMTSLIKLFEILDEKQGVTDCEAPKEVDLTGKIAFEEVQFGYKAYEPVLKDISLQIEPHEMIGIVGHSGAGKSTLINLIMRLYDTDIGQITIGGVDIREISQRTLRENIGVVFQETFLFSGTVYDNIAYAKPGATPAEIIRAAKAANAHEFIMRLSDGYNTIVGENGHNLSGGERQRISIARAVLKDPKILILDEATSALDPETEGKIQEALSRLTQNRTTIAIAHRLSTLRHADRLIVLEKGRLAEIGSHRELLEKQGIYYSLVSAQRQTSKLSREVKEAISV